jgi:Tfp pilus assembly protein PilX
MIFPTHDLRLPPKWRKNGFALVVTLSLMILLTLIAVGLLGLSTISLRISSQASAMAEARANARLALMLAIGDLQKQLGSDRRISAKAEILDKTPESAAADEVTNPHYLGVWDSWDAWLTDKKGSLSIQDT